MRNVLMLALIIPLALHAQRVRMDFIVKDYDGNPLDGVKIEYCTSGKLIAPYINAPDIENVCMTDADGKASDRFLCWDGEVDCYFKKDGYYPVSVLGVRYGANYDIETDRTTFATNRQSVAVKMKKQKNPQPMIYHHEAERRRVPSRKRVGYDLKVGDWVAPDGKGIVPDFMVYCEYDETEDARWVEGCLRFVQPGAGAYVKKMDSCLPFPIDHEVNTNETFATRFDFSWHHDKKKTTRAYSGKNIIEEDEYLVIRSRVKLDDKGNIEKANYSHVQGAMLGLLHWFVIPHCYFNPRVNDLNLEYEQER